MKVVYRLLGEGGGSWRAYLLHKDGLEIRTYEESYDRLSGPKEATKKFSGYINDVVGSVSCKDIIFYTNQEEKDVSPYLSNKLVNSSNFNTKYTPDNMSNVDKLWTISEYILNDSRYNISLSDAPKSPYVVYTDGSHWPDKSKNSCSVGFIIQGEKGNSFIMGSPVNASTRDNNVAEYYAVRSALQFLPEDTQVDIKTDSTNVRNLTNDDVSNPPFDEAKILQNRISKFDSITIERVKRNYTEFPDKLAEVSKWSPIVAGQTP